jgi:hypothetical protein
VLPCVFFFSYVSSCVWVPALPTFPMFHLGTPLSNSFGYNLFTFRGSEKGLKGDPLFFGSPEGEIKREK